MSESEAEVREVPWVIDGSAGTLAPRRNEDGAANREIITAQSFIGNTSFRGEIRAVQHGTYNSKPACLLVLDFYFIFNSDEYPRFKSADIIILFSKTADGLVSDASDEPIGGSGGITLKNFAPRRLYGMATVEKRSWTFGLAIPLQFPLGPVSPGLEPSVEFETKFPRQHRMESKGFPISSENSQTTNGVKFTLKENAKDASGIPDLFTCMMLVEYDGSPFQATVDVSVGTHLGYRFKAMPWSKDDPILLRAGANKSNVTSKLQFEDLVLEDWLPIVKNPRTPMGDYLYMP